MYNFDPANFRLLYPEFADLTDTQLMNFYYGSIKYYTPLIVGYDDNQSAYIINLIVAHLIAISPQGNNNSSSGRISSATEGSVNTSFSYNDSKSGWFWNGSSYGQEVYQLMLMHGGVTYISGTPARYRNCRNRNYW